MSNFEVISSAVRRGSIMKLLPRIGLLGFLFAQLALCVFAQSGIITTYAGAKLPVNGAQAITQALDFPPAVAVDGAGGFYVSSQTQHRIYRVAADGSINLTAGVGSSGYSGDGGPATAAQLDSPWGVAVDSAGNLYIADQDNNRIRKVTTVGIISTVAGNGTSGYSGDRGPATAAKLSGPTGVAVDSAGNLYIADINNNRIRKVTTAGIISTVAGNGTRGYSGDGGPATAAKINNPTGVAVDSAGNLYIVDSQNDRIRKVTTSGIISTAAGNGIRGYSGDGGQATAAQLSNPQGVAVDSGGNLYIAFLGNSRIRKVTAAGIISAVAGNGTGGYGGDGGVATAAQLRGPTGVAVDSAGNLYIADYGNKRIRKVTTAGIIRTVAGNGYWGRDGDTGPATAMQLYNPTGVAVDSAGNLYIAELNGQRIRKVTTAGIISTAAGNGTGGYSGDGGPATAAKLNNPTGVAVDFAGNLYIAEYENNRIRKVTTAGRISTVAGNGTSGYSGDGGAAPAAQLHNPYSVAVDSAGNLYIADTTNNRIRKVTTAGIISTLAGGGTGGLGDGGPATEAKLVGTYGVAIDSAGNLYISDLGNNRIRKVTTAGIISTVAGGGTGGLGDGAPATAAKLNYPIGVAVDSAGNLYIADSQNKRVRRITTAGMISTVAGNGTQGYSGDGGPAPAAQLHNPWGVAVDSAGNLYIADLNGNRIRKVSR
jgi:trimeric autotransporter adhesin